MEELDCDPFPHNRRCCADTFRFLIRHGNLGAGRLWPDAERAGLGADAGRQSGGEILSGLGLVLFIIGIWTGKPRTKPGLWLSCLLALWLAVTVPGPGFEPVIDAGFRSPFGAL